MKTERPKTKNSQGLVAMDAWLHSMGHTLTTGWRWRKAGWIDVINIAGRNYVTAQAIARFTARAEAGEFSKKAVVPDRRAAA